MSAACVSTGSKRLQLKVNWTWLTRALPSSPSKTFTTRWVPAWFIVHCCAEATSMTRTFLPKVHGPDRTVREGAQPGEADGLLQQPERVRLRGGVPPATHFRLPTAGARLLSALHWGRTLRQGVLPAGGCPWLHLGEFVVSLGHWLVMLCLCHWALWVFSVFHLWILSNTLFFYRIETPPAGSSNKSNKSLHAWGERGETSSRCGARAAPRL